MTPFERQVLSDLREMKADLKNSLERVTKLEVHDHQMFGNGQPGWRADTDDRIDELEKQRSTQRGALWMLGGIGSVAGSACGWILERLIHGAK